MSKFRTEERTHNGWRKMHRRTFATKAHATAALKKMGRGGVKADGKNFRIVSAPKR